MYFSSNFIQSLTIIIWQKTTGMEPDVWSDTASRLLGHTVATSYSKWTRLIEHTDWVTVLKYYGSSQKLAYIFSTHTVIINALISDSLSTVLKIWLIFQFYCRKIISVLLFKRDLRLTLSFVNVYRHYNMYCFTYFCTEG